MSPAPTAHRPLLLDETSGLAALRAAVAGPAPQLAAFAEQVGAVPQRRIALVLDGAGWRTSAQLVLPERLHLIPLPPYSPELQPAERLWRYSNAPLLKTHFSDLQALEEAQMSL